MSRKVAMGRILAVDDSPDTLDALLQNLCAEGYEAVGSAGAEEALVLLEREAFDVVITDMKMPGMGGMELMKIVRERHPDIELMMITGYATIEGAVEAVKTGAEEYLSKPFTIEELFAALERLREKQRRRREFRGARGRFGMIGESDGMRRAFAAMEQAARHPGPVLILGESGTGRARAARAMARERGLSEAPFVAADAQDLRPAWLERMGGGHEGGGSVYLKAVDTARRDGLDVLRGLLAGHKLLPVDLFLSADPDLALRVERGLFPEDLFSLLGSNTVALPALRDRGNDVLLLANYFAEGYSSDSRRGAMRFSKAAQGALLAYSWPGNVEELREGVARACLRCAGEEVGLEGLPTPVAGAAEGFAHRTLAQAERDHIRRVLASVGGHRSRAAEILKIDPKTLREKIKAAGMEAAEP